MPHKHIICVVTWHLNIIQYEGLKKCLLNISEEKMGKIRMLIRLVLAQFFPFKKIHQRTWSYTFKPNSQSTKRCFVFFHSLHLFLRDVM